MAVSYAPMWEMMKEKGFTTYSLKVKSGIGGSTYDRLKKNEHISTFTIEKLCEYFDCEVTDILKYEKQ
jgi:DNA-binding Xre family transcriptional regulator